MLIAVEAWHVQLAMFMSNEEWLNKLPAKEEGEEDMLDMAFEPKTK